MLPICYVCLRSNVKLNTLEDQLELLHFYDELCDYNFEDFFYQFCMECIGKLKRCNDFRKQCHLAHETLKTWKKTKLTRRVSISELYKQIPPAHMAISNSKNFKVYFYQAVDLGISNPIQISSFHPHIMTVTIPSDDNPNDLIKQEIPLEMTTEETLKVFTDNFHIEIEQNKIKDEYCDENLIVGLSGDENCLSGDENRLSGDENRLSGDEKGSSDCGLKNDESDSFSDSSSDSDISLKQLLSDLKKKKGVKDEKEQAKAEKRKKRQEILRLKKEKYNIKIRKNEKEKFVAFLNEKFKNGEVVKDEKGNLIDLDKIVSLMDTMPLSDLQRCRKAFRAGPATPADVKKLSQIQTQYIEIASVFDTEYLNSASKVRAEFARRCQYPDYVDAPFRCEECVTGFKTKKRLDFHRRILHNPTLTYVCELCKMRFKSKNEKSWHYTRLHRHVYRCKRCPFIVNNRDGMEIHFRKHEGLKYTCEHCNMQFNLKNQWYHHMSKHHNDFKGPYIYCEFCGFSTYSSIGLTLHKSWLHKGEKMIESDLNKKCEECNTVFINEDIHDKHVRKAHRSDQEPKKSAHRRRYKKPVNIYCKLCNATGVSPGWLMKHFRRDHPTENVEAIYRNTKKYLCDECGKGFPKKCTLIDHMNTHSGVKPYCCPDCGAAFYTRLRLYRHKERHLPPLQCDTCGKAFRSKSNLYSHKLIHKGDRCHKCEHCGKGFITRSLLKEHVRGVHLNIRRKRKIEGE